MEHVVSAVEAVGPRVMVFMTTCEYADDSNRVRLPYNGEVAP